MKANDRSKFNVSSNKSDRMFNNIVFDSKLEMEFYRDIVLPNYKKGKIKTYELQKEYTLQDKFKHDGKTVRAIKYVADFYIEDENNNVYVIDIKGFEEPIAKIKKKMFWYLYPDIKFLWLGYCKKYGGWIQKEKLNKLRKK